MRLVIRWALMACSLLFDPGAAPRRHPPESPGSSVEAERPVITVAFIAQGKSRNVRELDKMTAASTRPVRLDVTAAAVGTSATSSSGTATTTSAKRQHGVDGHERAWRRIHEPYHHQARRRYRRRSNRNRHWKLSGHCPPVVRRPLGHADGGIPRTIRRFSRSLPD